MPEISRRPRRRMGGEEAADFNSQAELYAALDALLAKHGGDGQAAEASAEWPGLRRRATRWLLKGALGRRMAAQDHAVAIAGVYLREPSLRPALPPPGLLE